MSIAWSIWGLRYLLAVIPPILRHEYIQLLEKAHRDASPFEEFIAERVIESQKEIMRLLHIPIPKPEKGLDV